MDVLRFATCSTPHGEMLAAASERGLCRLLPPGHGLDELHTWTARHRPGVVLEFDSTVAGEIQPLLDGFFDGRPPRSTPPLDLIGTPFQRAVWQAVCQVPYGETRSYAEIARQVGRPAAWRAVGAANAINPVCLIIPCHRIIGADGTLKGYAGGILSRTLLLEIERRASRTLPAAWADRTS